MGAPHPRGDGTGKQLSVREAIRQYVRPGMTLHLAGGLGGPSAAICEIIRQFRDGSPHFELIQGTVTGHAPNMIHAGLIVRMIFAACMEISDTGRPSRVFQRAYREKRIDARNWSLCSLQQRLMAGAMGFPFAPTRSIGGSSLAPDLSGDFIEIDNPFQKGEKTGLVKALRPDISIIHGCVADEEGNTILGAPVGDDLWGAFASKEGVLVSVEKIVTADFIRRHSSLVNIPAYLVRAVSVAPFGVHPFSLVDPGVADFEPYGMDHDFLKSLSKASRDVKSLDAWMKEWVIDCDGHEAYLDKIGSKKRASLKEAAIVSGAAVRPPAPVDGEEYTPEEMMLVAIGREVARSIKQSGHEIVLVGAGSRAVGPWLAYYGLRAEGVPVEMITGNGQVDYTPLPGEAFLQTVAGMRTSKMLTDTITTHGVIVGGAAGRCLSVLGGAQVDRYGNINSTRLSDEVFLVGSGGGNDSVNAREVIVVIDQLKTRFLETLPYVTSKGDRVTTVVSTMGVFRKTDESGILKLAACFPDARLGPKEKIQAIQDGCGWLIETAETVEELPPPTREELSRLRWLVSTHAVKAAS